MKKGKIPMEKTPTQPIPMNFIIWNVREANSIRFRRHYEAMVNMHKPSVLVLLETRMTEHKRLTEVLQFDSQIPSSTDGLSGGIVIMWKKNALKLEDISITAQSIHVMVQVIPELNP